MPTTSPEPFTMTRYASSFVRKRLSQAEAALKEAYAWLDNTDDFDGDSAFEGLAHIKRLRRLANRIEKTLEDGAIAQMHHYNQVYRIGDGYTAVLRPARERRGWDNAAVMADLEERVVEKVSSRNPAVAPSAVKAIVREAMWSVHKAGRIEWRSSDLRAIGLNPDSYSHHVSAPESLDMRGTRTHAQTRTSRKDLP